jgi:hypothetical protein
MTRALKVALILYGVIEIVLGLLVFFAPQQAAGMFGFEEVSSLGVYLAGMLGVCWIAAGIWFIVAGRDPLRYIILVKLAIAFSLLAMVAGLYSIIQGATDFSQAGTGIIIDVIFTAAFLVFYPWRTARE